MSAIMPGEQNHRETKRRAPARRRRAEKPTLVIALCGPPGVGKTVVGTVIAEYLSACGFEVTWMDGEELRPISGRSARSALDVLDAKKMKIRVQAVQ